MIVAFDLDGTLCNIEHRLHFIQNGKKDWPGFFAACDQDKPIHELIAVARTFIMFGHEVEIWSGRSDEVRPQTEAWLDKHDLLKGARIVRMRKAGDHRPDFEVKEEWLHACHVALRPMIAFDDRQQVVDMWRRNGIVCCQVAPGDF